VDDLEKVLDMYIKEDEMVMVNKKEEGKKEEFIEERLEEND